MTALAWTAVFTGLLAAFAIVTAWYARKAFRGQAEELGVLQQQAKDQAEELGIQRRQAEGTTAMIEIQSGQLAAQRDQLAEQRAVNEKQTGVLELQARELSESLAERKRHAEEQRRAQASQVAAWFGLGKVATDLEVGPGRTVVRPAWGAFVRNESALPVLSVRVFFHYIQADTAVSEDWTPIIRGGPVSMIRVLPPRSEQFVEIPYSVRNMISECNENTYAVSLEFMDAAENRWERDARGALKER
jgi:nitrogen fixation protein FixH